LAVKEGTMKAIVQDRYGTADVLALSDTERPRVADDEVLVRVLAAGVDRGVWHIMTGRPYFLRLMGSIGLGLRAPKNPVRGSDVAGVVEATGKDVTRFHPGDEVFGIGKGSFAEYVCVSEAKLAPKPANLSFEQAAVLPISGLSALQAVRDAGKVRSGQKVLVIGASGGVGTFAVQIAKSYGADVTGVCSTTKVDLVRSLGADHVIDYTRNDYANGDERYDVILDTGGNSSLSRLRHALTSNGILVIVGGETNGPLLGGFDRSIRAALLSRFLDQELIAFANSENHEDMIVLKEMVEAGKVGPVMDRTFPLSEAPTAIRYLKEGHARGKIAITV
jgi:NADPH:quinone reductase-like Zn-dependent oxidoreductase